jgi:catechol 2,3-dioxygenase-like lactoylglutathione lyase family enzyme
MSPPRPISRRQLLLSLPALTIASKIRAQPTSIPPIPVRSFSHFVLKVADVQRSVDFYQGLFGLPVQARQGSTVLLRVGPGPQYLGLTPAGSSPPAIGLFGLKVEGFNADRVMRALVERGMTKAEPGDPGPSGGALKARLVTRSGTPEIYIGDPDGLIAQLQDASYCGGSGPLGAVCRSLEPFSKKSLLAVRDMSHATIRVSDSQRTASFYQRLFGLQIQGHQGAAPFYGLGRGPQFLMFAGGGSGAAGRGRGAAVPAEPRIDHVCLSMTRFDPVEVTKALNDYGIRSRETGSSVAGPLVTYVTLRMPERGGAPGGTPELYFTDPDGLLMQLQDITYCGGSGFLGDVCTG